MPVNVALRDFIKVPTQRTLTDAGQLIVPCAFARTGVQVYSAGQLGLQDREANTPVKVFRDEAEVFEEASIASFRSSPATLGHPVADGVAVAVTSENAATYQKGFLEGLPARDEDTLSGTLVITNQDAIDEIDNGTSELSAGYTCDIVLTLDEEGNERITQTNIRANHIAIVSKGRAGSSCRLADAEDSIEVLSLKLDLTDALAKLTNSNEISAGRELEISVLEEAATKLTTDLAASTQALEDAAKDLDVKVAELSDTIIMAKDMTDLEDFTGKTVQEIRKLVVQSLSKDQTFDDKEDSYISARFDLLHEANMLETPMGKLLRDNATPDEIVPAKDTVKEARDRMVQRQTNS
jgi:hypothetical protein